MTWFIPLLNHIQQVLILNLQLPHLGIQLVVLVLQLSVLIAFLHLLHTCVILLYHLYYLLQLLYGFLLRFQQFDIIQLHRVRPVHLVYSTYIMPRLEILWSRFSYYLDSCVPYSWIRLWTHMSAFMSCRLCLFYLVIGCLIVMFGRSTYSKRFFPSTLSLELAWTCSTLSLNKMVLFNFPNLWTLGRDDDVGWFFVRTRRFDRLVIGTHITLIPICKRSRLVFFDCSLEYSLHALVI